MLSSAKQDVPVSKVLSEGENRAIALASFLTEVSLAAHPSAIVLDDPVSSLDHKRRDKIARRLVDEAAVRQVIIFTHDLRFLFDLQSAADHNGLTPTFQTAFSGYKDAGRIREGLPWEGMTAERRIRKLKNDWQQASALYRASDEAAYIRLAKDIYTELRETWKRAVELILPNEVVTRFGKGVQTQRLAKLLDITQQDYDRVEAGMSRCSDFAHDAALEGAISIPPPDEIEQDIGELEAWMEEIKTRRKKQR